MAGGGVGNNNTTADPPKDTCLKIKTLECTNKTEMGTLFFPFIPHEEVWNQYVRGVLYFMGLCWIFMGVAIASDIFMGAIEYIVSKSKTIPFDIGGNKTGGGNTTTTKGGGGKEKGGSGKGSKDEGDFKSTVRVEVRVWNPTVANLTLMALGSSAPEILLSVIETFNHKFMSEEGDLGPGTIVGSAAFNLLMITAVCIIGVPRGEVRKIAIYNVFLITTIFSLFAYIWLWVVLEASSCGVVEVWEALVTLFCFPLLVLIAWWADNAFCLNPKKNLRKSLVEKVTELQLNREGAAKDDSGTTRLMTQDETPFYNPSGGVNQAALLSFYKDIRENAELTDEEAASLVAYKMVQTRRHSRLWYRMGACRALMGSPKIQPTLNEKLQVVYNVINEYEKKDPAARRLTLMEVSPDMLHKKAIFDFQAAAYSVPENIGILAVIITRSGRMDNEVTVRVSSIEGTAKEVMDFEKVDVRVVFEPFVHERQVDVVIKDDTQAEGDESFFLRLSLTEPAREDAMLGPTHTMEINIVDNDKPGTLSFARRGQLVSEMTRQVDVEVLRTSGTDGIVVGHWKTVPDPTGGVKHPTPMVGKITFQHAENSKLLHVPLFQDNNENKESETFDIILTGTDGRAILGKMTKTSITISDDASFQETVNKVVEMAAAEMDIIGSANTTIRKQLVAAFQVGDDEDPSKLDYVMHFVTFPWKVLLALIPPPNYLGGWLCFFASLAAIGVLTAVIGDIATIFGCIICLKPTITAITFVALGTSLPDTFASMAAAKHDDSADNAIGNVTGSNSVNVFLGLGLPWTIAVFVHMGWKTPRGYEVPPGSLGFSVIVYSAVAVVAVILLTARRFMKFFGKAELGGPTGPKYCSAVFLIGLWFLYIGLSALEAYGTIPLKEKCPRKK